MSIHPKGSSGVQRHVLGLETSRTGRKTSDEGKAGLFKRFADIDVFDIELDEGSGEVVNAVRAIAPTFGISIFGHPAPECFILSVHFKT